MNSSNKMPPLYPFPDDEILYPRRSSWDDFDPETDSYFALGRIPEDKTHIFDGEEHENYLRLVIRTPEKGSMAMLANHGDMQALAAIGLRGMLNTQDDVLQDEAGQNQISTEWLANLIGERPEDIFL
jgi:hypothetical protein